MKDREQIALKMLEGHISLISAGIKIQAEFISNALNFADTFLSIAENQYETVQESIDKTE